MIHFDTERRFCNFQDCYSNDYVSILAQSGCIFAFLVFANCKHLILECCLILLNFVSTILNNRILSVES